MGLANSLTQSGAYSLVMVETGGKRRLPIVIGSFEAQAIAVELESLTPTRPLTHDLFRNFAQAFGINITEVVIYNLKEGVFYSKLMCSDDSHKKEIDARTSDAIAMALRFNCPIYTYDWILAQAGVNVDEEGAVSEEPAEKQKTKGSRKKAVTDYSSLSEEELKESLMKALDDEAYEVASKIRDELNKRKKT